MPSEEEWSDADMLAEEATGYRPGNPEQGIKDMERRITVLKQRLHAVLDRLGKNPTYHALAEGVPHAGVDANGMNDLQAIGQLNLDLAEARTRLAEYEQQLKGRN